MQEAVDQLWQFVHRTEMETLVIIAQYKDPEDGTTALTANLAGRIDLPELSETVEVFMRELRAHVAGQY